MVRTVLDAYGGEYEVVSTFERDVEVYAAIEMLRRTIGAARMAEMNEPGAAFSCLDLAEAVVAGRERLVD